MYAYIIKRFFLMIPTLVGVITIFFFISEFVPGGPYDQIIAMIRGNNEPQGEVAHSGPPGSTHDKMGINIDPKDEYRIKRIYGLNRSRLERYLRTLLWFKHDSITSSLEIDPNSSQRLNVGRQKYFILRIDQDSQPQFYVYENNYILNAESQEVYAYDFEKNAIRNIQTGVTQDSLMLNDMGLPVGFSPLDLNYDAERGAIQLADDFYTPNGDCLDHLNQKLPLVPSTAEYEVISDIVLNQDGTKSSVDVPRWELYLNQDFKTAICDWNNWHGFFILKFPDSIRYKKPAYEVILSKLPVSIRLGVSTFFLTYIICIILGIAKAVREGSTFDAVTSMVILIGYSIPGFVLAVFLLKCFGPNEPLIASWIPLGGMHSTGSVYDMMSPWQQFWDNVWHMLAPILCMSIGSFAMLTFLTKNSILEHTHKLYAVAARARGLSERRVLYKHILRNSLIPLVTGFPSGFLMMFFGGSLLIEKIFNLDGIGLLGFTALTSSDFPLLMSNLFMFTLLGLLARLLTDICYVIVDPRISFDGGR